MTPLRRHDADVLRTTDHLYLETLTLKRETRRQIAELKQAKARGRFTLLRWRGVAGVWKVRKILEMK